MEFWTWSVAEPAKSVDFARRAEEQGWDGMGVGDSQSMTSDPYVYLALAATATDTLGLATSVTNPVTQHPAVTAASAVSLQRLSGGRMVLGIGRGASALAHLGRAPARLPWFETHLQQLQTYLAGAKVAFDESCNPDEAAPPVERLGFADAPKTSLLRWTGDEPKVPVEVDATGPRVICIAARHADRVMFAVGADPKRITWAIETAREAAEAFGRDPDSLGFGAYVNVVCDDDRATGRELSRASTRLSPRFSAMYGKVSGSADDERQADVFRRVHERYDMNAHGKQHGRQIAALTDNFIDSNSIVGPSGYCADRLTELGELGVTKISVIGPNFVTPTADTHAAASRFTDEVLPRLRR